MQELENGIVRIKSNNVQSGKILSIEADELTSGNAIEVSHKGNGLTTGSLLHLNSSASNAQNGIANVVGNNIETGNVVAIEGNSLNWIIIKFEIPFIKFNRRCFSYRY